MNEDMRKYYDEDEIGGMVGLINAMKILVPIYAFLIWYFFF